MNQRKQVNTSPKKPQAENATLPLLQISSVRQHLGDIESQALAAHTLTEICFEELDRAGEAITDPAGHKAVLRLDALMKSVFRNVALIQASVELAGAEVLHAEGAAA